MCLEFQKLKITCLCCCVHPVIVNKTKKDITLFVLALLAVMPRKECPIQIRKNDSNPDEIFKLTKMSNGWEVCVALCRLWAFCKSGDKSHLSVNNFQRMDVWVPHCKVNYSMAKAECKAQGGHWTSLCHVDWRSPASLDTTKLTLSESWDLPASVSLF